MHIEIPVPITAATTSGTRHEFHGSYLLQRVKGAYYMVVLQKVVEDRKLPKRGISYATTPKISAMNFTHSLTAPFSTFSTCPFLSMFIVS